MADDDFVEQQAEVAAEKLIKGNRPNQDSVEVDKNDEMDKKLEKDVNSNGFWSEQEIEYLKNNSQEMSNDELKDFLMKKSDFQESDFERFSQTEKKYVMKNFPAQDAEKIAEQLDRPEEEVRKKIKMLGLGNKLKSTN